MAGDRATEVRERFQAVLDLADLAEEMMRAKLRRTSPVLTEAEIDAAIEGWLLSRPGAEDGDAVGRRVEIPRRR